MNSELWHPGLDSMLAREPAEFTPDARLAEIYRRDEPGISQMMVRIRRAIRFIHSHIMERITLADLADVACYSPWHFDRMFQRQIGVPPMAYLTLTRIAVARRQITVSAHSVINVAYDVGYNSVGSFGKRFTALVGCCPSSLREAAQRFERSRFAAIASLAATASAGFEGRACRGTVALEGGASGYVFLALQRRGRMTPYPLTCAVARAPGPFAIPIPGAGPFELVALGFPDDAEKGMLITQDDAPRTRRELMLSGGDTRLPLPLLLGPPNPEDIPIPPVFPLLLDRRFSAGGLS
jgi:AraC-like DNA-binding protein